jgi:pilus assembly protein CpaC
MEHSPIITRRLPLIARCLCGLLVMAMPAAAGDAGAQSPDQLTVAPVVPAEGGSRGGSSSAGVSANAPMTVLAEQSTAQAATLESATSPSGPVVTEGLDADGQLKLALNTSRLLVTATKLRSADNDGAALTEGSAEVASAVPVSPNSVLITAKKQGSTNLIIEDELGRRQFVEVIVDADLGALRQQLKELSPMADIQTTDDNGSLVLHGRVPNLRVADQATQIAAAYYGGPAKVINLLEVSGGQQVMLEVKFAEVSKTAMSSLGVNFAYTDGTTFIGNNIGQINPFTLSSADPFAQALSTAAPGSDIQLFGNIKFNNSAFSYFINCLRENNLMRTLAEPNLTAISGETASFQVGGQIPIPVPQQGSGTGTSGGSTITIQYENYGVILHFTPVVLGDGRIRLKIDPEVSDLDYAHGVSIGGFTVPGFTTRTVDTTVELADGQTFTIAGLLNNQVTATTDTVPGLGDLPILGALFRSVQYQRNQTELVVMVTPRLVEAVNPDRVTAGPGEHWRYPTEADVFLSGDMGGELPAKAEPAAAAGPAPQFHGQYGFAPTNDTLVVEP